MPTPPKARYVLAADRAAEQQESNRLDLFRRGLLTAVLLLVLGGLSVLFGCAPSRETRHKAPAYRRPSLSLLDRESAAPRHRHRYYQWCSDAACQ